MSTETPDHAHDPARRVSDGGRDESNRRSEPDDEELVVVVCPKRVYERLRPELDESRERLCRRYEREHEDLLAERAQLEDEVACLERQLERKQSQLDAVVSRNEQILEERTQSFRRRIENGTDGDGSDGFLWSGQRRESGLLARLKNWLR